MRYLKKICILGSILFAAAIIAVTSGDVVKAEAKTGTKKKIIAIDPGHQSKGDSKTEAIGPGAKTKKARVAGGTTGVSSKVPEYKLTLQIAKKVKKELEKRGYEVVMTRTKNNVNISNKERAILANESGANLCIRLHADGSELGSVNGASALYPSKDNPYVSKLSAKSKKLAQAVIKNYCRATGARNRGTVKRDDLTGTNWSTIPVIVLEMGFMSNSKEDKNMQKSSYQKKMVKGICDGIDAYFE